jgi:AraC-like DNA-binding protein
MRIAPITKSCLLRGTYYGSLTDMLDGLSYIESPRSLDPLSAVLQDLHLADVSSGRGELAHPWGIAFAPKRVARFHFVASGHCWLGSPDGQWSFLTSGDAVLLPHGVGHTLASTKGGSTRPWGQIPRQYLGETAYRICENGGAATTLLFCCSVIFGDLGIQPLLDLMPSVLLLRSAAHNDPMLPTLLEAMAAEVHNERIGSATMLSRIADVVIARVVRAWAEEHREDTGGWLAAINDPKIGRALAAIHREPGRDWTLAALSDVACTSRSGFTERFAQLVGVAPARYLTRLRMQIASGWLRTDRLGVAQVAERLGYESEASFSRAFKRHIGVSPGEIRRGGQFLQNQTLATETSHSFTTRLR